MSGLYLDLNGASYHSGRDGYDTFGYQTVTSATPEGFVVHKEPVTDHHKYRQQNPGIGARYEWGDGDTRPFVTAGEYLNSRDRQTEYLGAGITQRFYGSDSGLHVNAGGMIGGMTGYGSGIGNGVTLAALPMFQVGYGPASLSLMYAPRWRGSPQTYMLNGSYKLW